MMNSYKITSKIYEIQKELAIQILQYKKNLMLIYYKEKLSKNYNFKTN